MRSRFVIRRARLNQAGTCPVNCRITVNKIKTSEFAVGLSVDPKKWDSKLQRVKGAANSAVDINRRLDIIKSELEEIYLSARSRGVHLSALEVKDIYLGKTEITFYYSKMAANYHNELVLKGRAKTTLNRYKRCFAYLADYLKVDMVVGSIERRHVAGFWLWLKSRDFHNDYCNKIVQACIGLFRYGIREGLFERNPFSGYTLEWKKELDTTALDPHELEQIKEYEWSPRLQRVVDSFLFMCYTGLHIGDYRDVRQEARYTFEGVEFMKVRRIKTNVEAVFPLSNDALAIIDKYGGLNNLPRISGQKSNDYLKLIAERVGITKNMTNKMARKTFTDVCLNDYGLSDEVVAKMLGHTTTRQVKHYGRIKERRIVREWKDKIEVA
ncbi:site-specific integrase [Dyadobacter alkalitolerans]|uniref:site-specific integrase n=1 Tax=Dyadobacter alkalitolerans TaxID=492736 RepID=UPI00146FB255|nr:site-specific integrase [Dyadobacter alkalitolerans]